MRLLDKLYYNNTTEMRKDDYSNAKLEETTEGFIADWSKPFNLLAQTYTNNEGFTVWVDNGDLPADSAVIMRLPKQHSSYNYYTPDGVMLPEHEEENPGAVDNDDPHNYDEYTDAATSLKRTDNVRFIYEKYENDNYDNLAFAEHEKAYASTYVNNGYEEAYANRISAKYHAKKPENPFVGNEATVSVEATTNDNSNKFVVGNMFMSDIDIKTFLNLNTNVRSLYRYNGNNYDSYTLNGNELIVSSGEALSTAKTEDEGNNTEPETRKERKKVIHPLESFFISTQESNKNARIVFTRDMMLNTVANETAATRSAGYGLPMMRVMAEAGGWCWPTLRQG